MQSSWMIRSELSCCQIVIKARLPAAMFSLSSFASSRCFCHLNASHAPTKVASMVASAEKTSLDSIFTLPPNSEFVSSGFSGKHGWAVGLSQEMVG